MKKRLMILLGLAGLVLAGCPKDKGKPGDGTETPYNGAPTQPMPAE